MRSAALATAVIVLTACSYEFSNPAEALRAGEVRGRALSDAGAGVAPNPGVSVSLKHSDLTQLTRDTGLFVVVPLPEGRHTLLFRKGTVWAIERDVEIRLGSDGQPEGVSVGDVVLRYSAAVEGSVALPSSAPPLLGGTVVDETTGLTAELTGATFGFPVLSTGVHRVRVAAEDQLGGKWVGGPVDVELTDDLQQQAVQLSPLGLRPSSGQGVLRFQVQGVGGTVDPAAVTVTGLPVPAPVGSGGLVEVTVPEGRYDIGLTTPPAGGVLVSPRHGPVASLAAPELLPPSSKVTVVVLADQPLDAGPVYLVAPEAASEAALACSSSADCACYDPGCKTDGTCGSTGLCEGWMPPPAVPAGLPFCDLSQERPICTKASGTCATTEYCAVLGTSPSGFCLPCGYACTVDGKLATAPGPGECGVPGVRTVSGSYFVAYHDELGTGTLGPPRNAATLTVRAVPASGSASIPGTYASASGTFVVDAVPDGQYTLIFDDGSGVVSGVQHAGTGLAIEERVSERQTTVRPTLSTPASFDVANLSPWQSSDRFVLASAGAGVTGNLLGAPGLALSATAATVTWDWLADLPGAGLPDGAQGDVLWLAQLGTVTVSGLPAGATVRSSVAHARLTGVTLVDGQPSTTPAALQVTPQSGALSLDVRDADWLTPITPDLPTFVVPLRSEVRVHAIPGGTAFPARSGVDPTLWQALVPSGTGDYAFTTPYGQYLDASWGELVWVRRVWQASFTATGASASVPVNLSAWSEYPVAALPARPVPALGPPRALRLNGLDAFQRQAGVGTSPALSWDAPASGTPTRYQVAFRRLANAGGVTTDTLVAYFQVYGQSFIVPAGLLASGGEYYAFVSAISSANDVIDGLAVYGGDYPAHLATNLTAVFTP